MDLQTRPSNGHSERDLSVLAEAAVERARQEYPDRSRQVRFNASDVNSIFASLFNATQFAELNAPAYSVGNSRKRDAWLREFVRIEPHLEGVLKAITDIDKNRGLIFTGPERQVNRYRRILIEEADYGRGWRWYNERSSSAFNTADLGSPTECPPEVLGGPLAAIYNVDPAMCRLRNDPDFPLEYNDEKWLRDWYFLLTSMPSTREKDLGLGRCFVSRAMELAKLMYAVFAHDNEMVGARMPRGLLILQGITEEQWKTAMKARGAELDGAGYKYFGNVAVLASPNPIQDIKVTLIALSNLPANFDREKFIAHTLYAYALAAGYDAAEFWPVQFGALGRGQETQLQHRKGTGKGGLDYVLLHQEALQRRLPRTLLFQYEERDVEGEEKDADLALKRAQLAINLYMAGIRVPSAKLQAAQQESDAAAKSGDEAAKNRAFEKMVRALQESPSATTATAEDNGSLITRDEARALLVMHKVIPRWWTEMVEDVTATDKDAIRNPSQRARLRDEVIGDMHIQRAIRMLPEEPVVRYQYPSNTWQVLWERGGDALKRAMWSGWRQTL